MPGNVIAVLAFVVGKTIAIEAGAITAASTFALAFTGAAIAIANAHDTVEIQPATAAQRENNR